jgi:hypothetical protein
MGTSPSTLFRRKIMMKQLVAVLGASLFTVSLAYAQATAPAAPAAPAKSAAPAAASTSSCETQAVSKSGKPLSGAAKASFIKKCEGGGASAAASCETKAVSREGKPLAGAAKTSFMKKCESMAAK